MSRKKKNDKYTDGPIKEVREVDDFLPAPKDLVLNDETVKVTLSLTKRTVDYFKQEANINHTQYQKMIRALLDHYAAHHEAKSRKRH